MVEGEGRTVIARNRLTGEEREVAAERLVFRPSAYAVIVQDGRVLLNTAWEGHDFPGGGIEKGESLRDGLMREVKEETGLAVDIGPLLHVGEDFFIANFVPDTCFHSLLYYFLCTNPRGDLSTDGFAEYEKDYMKAPQWVPLDELAGRRFYNPIDSIALIRKAAEGKEYTVTV